MTIYIYLFTITFYNIYHFILFNFENGNQTIVKWDNNFYKIVNDLIIETNRRYNILF